MFEDNSWYGNRYIFSRYLGLNDKVASASIQHGYLSSETVYRKRIFSFIPWLVWNKFLNEKLKKNGHKNTFAVGSPFLYLHKILKPKKIKFKGTLIIPSKSHYEIDMIIDYEGLYKFVKKKFKAPYAILVGSGDLERVKKIRGNFNNCKFITCGRRTNKFFTFNLYNYLYKYKTVVHFYPGSSILYSLFLKKKTYYFQKRFVKKIKGKGIFYKNEKELMILKKEDKKIIHNFKTEYGIDFRNLNSNKNFKKVKKALGGDCFKKKNELLDLLGWNSIPKYILALILKPIFLLRNFELLKIKSKINLFS